MTRWEFLVAQRRYFVGIGWLMFGVAFATWGARLILHRPITLPAEVTWALFGMWGFSIAQALGQLAAAQAREDMRRVGRGEQPE